MQEKYEKYKRHDWPNDKEWQTYVSNLYPMPKMEVLEKIRRKWYKKNRDSDFDVEYKPDLDAQNRAN